MLDNFYLIFFRHTYIILENSHEGFPSSDVMPGKVLVDSCSLLDVLWVPMVGHLVAILADQVAEDGDAVWKQDSGINIFTNFMHIILTKVLSDNLKVCPRFVLLGNN